MLKFNALICWALISCTFLITPFCSVSFGQTTTTGCPGFRTQTQGGWGAKANGNNPAMFLKNNFASSFPNGITIGCTNKYTFNSVASIGAFLPSGSTPSALPTGNFTNPTGTFHSNVLAGQLLALAINIGFDNTIPSFGSSNLNLRNLVIASGSFQGWTVQQLFDEANKKIGGCAASSLSFSTFNQALTAINEGYNNGISTNNFLLCPVPCTLSLSLQQGAVTPVSCFSGSNGAINITVSGGVAPVKFLWSNGSIIEDISNLSFGNYSVVATDARGCTATITTNINQPSIISVLENSTPVSCYNGANGSINLTVSGGTGALSVSWTDGATGASRSGLAAGSYSYTVKDANNCSRTGSVAINEPTQITVSLSVVSQFGGISCNNICDGSLLATFGGGTGNVSLLWSNGSTANPATALCSGDYTATVTDANGCSATSLPVKLANPGPIVITGNLTASTSCVCNGTATANVSGGTGSYSYLWSNSTTGTNSISNLCAGPVSVTVTDANGCIKAFNLGSVTRTEGCVATEIVSFTQKLRANGTPVTADRSIPELALGIPQNNNAPGTFFSLGFGGNVVLKISGGIYNKLGNDLRITETTFGPQSCNSYPERARIFISPDGVSWTDKGIVCQDGEFDIFPLPCINFVKIVDESNPANFPADADGYDVDGIQCINTTSARMADTESNTEFENNAEWNSKSVTLFPNPAENQLSIDMTGVDDNGTIQINIFDNVGKNVKSLEMSTNAGNFKFELPIADLKSGLYNVLLKGNGFSHSAKIVKK